MGLSVLLRLFQAGRLGLAPALSHGLREVGEENGDKEDDAHDDVVGPQGGCVRIPKQAGDDGQQQGDKAPQLHHKHHGVTHHIAGIELDERAPSPPPGGSPG